MNETASPPFAHALSQPITSLNWSAWMRRLLVCNPFYLCSAALFLFGINRLSIDPNFLSDETANLLFNFTALQGYELIVVATAIVLARRQAWYDSALLVVIDAGLLLVPFFLISHGVVTTRTLGLAFAAIAVALAVARYAAIRRFYSTFNLPAALLWLGLGILLFNAFLPFTFWPWVKPDMERWLIPNQVLWYAVVPLLASGAFLLPAPIRYAGTCQQRPWLPLLVYALWIIGTAVHVWCVGYLCDIPLRAHFLAPLALVTVWIVRGRLTDFTPQPALTLRVVLLLVTFVPPLLAASNPLLFQSLLAANIVAYLILFPRTVSSERTVVKELIVATGLVMITAAAITLVPQVHAPLSRPQIFGAAAVIASCGYALRFGHPALGVLAAALIFLVTTLGGRDLPTFVPVHAAAIFLLLQSLSWKFSGSSFSAVRFIAAAIWIASSLSWIFGDSLPIRITITAEGLFVLGVAISVRLVYGRWFSACVPIAATAVALLYPAVYVVRHASPGVTALIASTLLFALGTLLAWTRHRSATESS